MSASQLATLAAVGEERTANVGDVLFRVGDATYSFIAIRAGEVAILDAGDNEIIRHGTSGFLGEFNLLSGQTVFLTGVVTQPLSYIAVDREALRALLFDDGPLSDLVLSTFIARREALQRVEGIGIEIVGPRSSEKTMQMLGFARANRLPFTWHGEAPPDGSEPPLVRLPGGPAGLAAAKRLPFSFLFFSLGALPCAEWLDDAVARDDDGFILTGAAAGAENLLETSVPGIFAAGDVRSGSVKRCATAVGEASMAVQFVHAHLAAVSS